MGMPARHISSQSFDEILSDLGDDPAIPDPHGIRKPPAQSSGSTRPQNQSSQTHFSQAFNGLQIQNPMQKVAGSIAFLGMISLGAIAVLMTTDILKRDSQTAFEDSQKLILELKKEIVLMRDEIRQDQDDLYEALDKLEVSIHLLKEKRPDIRVSNKPMVPSHESELRRWRFLGATQMGSSHQAFFNTGKGSASFEKGGLVMGEWRLSSIEKEMVTLTHPQGKTLILKALKSEAN